jgi:hypothetical protein
MRAAILGEIQLARSEGNKPEYRDRMQKALTLLDESKSMKGFLTASAKAGL